MSEREAVKSLIDVLFMIKAQLHTERTDLLRSILSIAIMESEDVIEMIDDSVANAGVEQQRAAQG